MKVIKILVLAFTLCLSGQRILASECILKGEVRNRDSKVLVLHKCSENPKTMYENPIIIPIKNGTFQYTFSYSENEAYELVFQDELEAGSWRSIIFFPNAQVEFVLYPLKDADNNVILGGVLNEELMHYQIEERNLFQPKFMELSKIRKALKKENDYESKEYLAVLEQLRTTNPDDHEAKLPIYQKMDEMKKTGSQYTGRGNLLMDRQDSLKKALYDWKYAYMTNNPSLASYYIMWKDVFMEVKNDAHVAKLVVAAFPVFKKKYPNHVYTDKISSQLSGIQTIVIGNRYVDFKAPTLTGDTLQLSTLISNKVALIDLWGSWCGPCIAKSRSVVPIYQKYKGKGFEIVGIAREFKSTEAVKRRLAKEQFDWTNLVELDDKQNIWNKYGISNGSGLMVLVDRTGTILAIDPKPEELEKILQEKL